MTPTRPQAVRRQTTPPELRSAWTGQRPVPTRTLKNKNGRADPCRSPEKTWPYLLRLTAFLSSAPAENFATLRAAILIVAPSAGCARCGLFFARRRKCRSRSALLGLLFLVQQ